MFIFAFLPLALLAYYWLGRLSPRAAGLSLVVSSLIFYAWWRPSFALLLIGSATFNYLISQAIVRNEERDRLQSAILVLGVTINLAVLAYYKYLFSVVGFLDSVGVTHLSIHSIILPLGISFYTFTQIGYLIDCRQGMAKEQGFFRILPLRHIFPASDCGADHPSSRNHAAICQGRDLSFRPCEPGNRRDDVHHRIVQEGPPGGFPDTNIQFGICRAARAGAFDLVADGPVLFATDLFRFFRLFRHGDRPRLHVQRSLSTQFQFALQGAQHHRLLAALAYDADALPDALSLQSDGDLDRPAACGQGIGDINPGRRNGERLRSA